MAHEPSQHAHHDDHGGQRNQQMDQPARRHRGRRVVARGFDHRRSRHGQRFSVKANCEKQTDGGRDHQAIAGHGANRISVTCGVIKHREVVPRSDPSARVVSLAATALGLKRRTPTRHAVGFPMIFSPAPRVGGRPGSPNFQRIWPSRRRGLYFSSCRAPAGIAQP